MPKKPTHPQLTEVQYQMIVDLLTAREQTRQRLETIDSKLLSLYTFIDESYGTSVSTNQTEIHTDRTLRPVPTDEK